MKFDFSKSTDADLQNKYQLDKLDIVNKNILYITHVVDKISLMVIELKNSAKLQKQVDDYFEQDDLETNRSAPLEDMAQDGNNTDKSSN